METNNIRLVPFISESFTEQIKNLKIFLHNNVYTNEVAMNTLRDIIQYNNKIKTLNLEMDKHYKTITLTFEEIDETYEMAILNLLQTFFSDLYIQELLKSCENQFKYSLTDINFLKLMFNATKLSDNVVKIFL